VRSKADNGQLNQPYNW